MPCTELFLVCCYKGHTVILASYIQKFYDIYPSLPLRVCVQKLREAGIEIPEAGKAAGLQEENKALKSEVKTMKEELDSTKKGSMNVLN